MTTLHQLIEALPSSHFVKQKFKKLETVSHIQFNDFRLDSRQVNTGDVLILLKSHTQPLQKSRNYIHSVEHQAAFIITEIPCSELDIDSDKIQCPIVECRDIRAILGTLIQLKLAASDEDNSDINGTVDVDNMTNSLPKVIAVTGTNGKTTITQLVAQLCQSETCTTAVMGTAGNGRLGHLTQASHTTGDALAVQTFLRQMTHENVDILALEASSHGLDQQRLQGVPIEVAIYTNLSRDHLDYHPNMEDYASAKARLFDRRYFPTLTHAIINLDDDFAPVMLQTAANSGLEVWTYSIRATKLATFTAVQINPSLEGVEIELVTDFGTIWLESPLLGRFNVANLLAAITGAMAIGKTLEEMPRLVAQLQGADGRMQRITGSDDKLKAKQGCFIVDYAHTPDALEQVLDSLKPHCRGKLWAVFGCGGDRDRGKRPLMTQAGIVGADKVILTSDNPRTEDPEAILNDMVQRLTEQQREKVHIIVDRREAIAYAVEQAGKQDIVVVAGKGHETYQEVNGVRHDFDDRLIVKSCLEIV